MSEYLMSEVCVCVCVWLSPSSCRQQTDAGGVGYGGSVEGMSTASASRFLLEAQVLHTVVRLCVVMKGEGEKNRTGNRQQKMQSDRPDSVCRSG